jgi:hypothetical protein
LRAEGADSQNAKISVIVEGFDLGLMQAYARLCASVLTRAAVSGHPIADIMKPAEQDARILKIVRDL